MIHDKGGKPAIVTETDIIHKALLKGLSSSELTVAKIMTVNVTVVLEDTPLKECLEIMHKGRFRHLPVVNLAGEVVHLHDILKISEGIVLHSSVRVQLSLPASMRVVVGLCAHAVTLYVVCRLVPRRRVGRDTWTPSSGSYHPTCRG